MAEWRDRVYNCLYMSCNPQANAFIDVEDKNDFRWGLKLGWMLKWKRITQNQYDKLKNLIVGMGFKLKP